MIGFLALLLLMAGLMPVLADVPPQRVVSFNLCADQLVLALADPSQIAGLSPYAADPSLSVLAGQARNYPRVDWQAESTLAFKPDLVLTGAWDRPITRRLLNRFGVRVVTLLDVTDIESALRQVRETAQLLGHPERGAALIERIEVARARLALHRDRAPRTAMLMERGGFAAGPASLAATLLREAGLVAPPDAPQGIGGFVSLESLLVLRPELVFLKDPPDAPDDQGSLRFSHPALRSAYPPARRIALPTRLTLCGGPALVAALDYLADVMARVSQADRR